MCLQAIFTFQMYPKVSSYMQRPKEKEVVYRSRDTDEHQHISQNYREAQSRWLRKHQSLKGEQGGQDLSWAQIVMT